MDTLQFLTAILPGQDVWYFTATPNPHKARAWNHHACQSIEELAQKIAHLETGQNDVYYALSGYAAPFTEHTALDEKTGESKTRKRFRTKDNVKLVKAFWLDLDVGPAEEGKAPKYPTQRDALVALVAFLKTTGLPKPMVVSSGYGIHVYWPLTSALLPGPWRATALQLKALTTAAGLLADPSRTSDEASVLRPVGTTNKKIKNGVQAKPAVRVLWPQGAEPIVYADPNEFNRTILDSQKLYGIVPEVDDKSAKLKVNPNDLIVQATFQKTSAHIIAEKCQQIRLFKDTGGISEPHWYRSLQIMRHTVEGEALAHEWSAKHAEYNQEQTEMKLAQVRETGPTLCATFKDSNPDGCKNCKYATRISTPVQLGVIIPEAPPVKIMQLVDNIIKEIELPPPPAPFKRGADGLYADVDGVPLHFYEYDLFPTQIVKDGGTGEGKFIVRHQLPKEGWLEFDVPLAELASPTEFIGTLRNNFVHPIDNKWMVAFMNSYVKQIQNTQKINPLYTAFGWHGDGFLMGRRMFTRQGTYHAGVSSRMSEKLIKSYHTAGTHDEWIELVGMLDKPGMEALFAMVMIAFASPIFKFSGSDGVIANFWSPGTGIGKSLAAAVALGAYGSFDPHSAGSKDTANARIEKLGMLSNLPAYLDENTTIPDETLADLVYEISGGTGKDKLRSDSTYREGVTWKTILFTSGNKSLVGRVLKENLNAEAVLMRVFECQVETPAAANDKELVTLHRRIAQHYGHAGEIYLKYLVTLEADDIEKNMNKMFDTFAEEVGYVGKERFWYALAAACLYGFSLATGCGALRVKDKAATFNRMFAWFQAQVLRQRNAVKANKVTNEDAVALYFNQHIADRLVIQENRAGLGEISIIKEPAAHGKLLMQHNLTTGRIHVEQSSMRNHLTRNQLSVSEVRAELIASGKLIDHGGKDLKVTLGKGTRFAVGQVRVWEFDAIKMGMNDITKEGT